MGWLVRAVTSGGLSVFFMTGGATQKPGELLEQ